MSHRECGLSMNQRRIAKKKEEKVGPLVTPSSVNVRMLEIKHCICTEMAACMDACIYVLYFTVSVCVHCI